MSKVEKSIKRFEEFCKSYYGMPDINFEKDTLSHRTYKANDIENRWLGWQDALNTYPRGIDNDR